MNRLYEETAGYVAAQMIIHPNVVTLREYIETITELVRKDGRCRLTEKDFIEWMCLHELMRWTEEEYRPVKTSGDTFVYVKRPGLTRQRITLIRPVIQEELLKQLPQILCYAERTETCTAEWEREAELFKKSNVYWTI